MDIQKRLLERVQKVSSLCGVCFAQSVNRRGNLLSLVILQIYFISFSIFLTFSTLGGVKNPFYIVLLSIQVILPVLIEMIINFEAFNKKHLEVKIQQEFKELDDVFENELKVEELTGVGWCFSLFVLKFLVLIFVRILKIWSTTLLFALNVMFSELVSSSCDYTFSFYVHMLRVYIETYSKRVNSLEHRTKSLKRHVLAFHKIANLIKRRYSVSLFLNIFFSFITLVNCFYWFFIRIIYGPLKLLTPTIVWAQESKSSSPFQLLNLSLLHPASYELNLRLCGMSQVHFRSN